MTQVARAISGIHHSAINSSNHISSRGTALDFHRNLVRNLFRRDKLHLAHGSDGFKLPFGEQTVLAGINDRQFKVCQVPKHTLGLVQHQVLIQCFDLA